MFLRENIVATWSQNFRCPKRDKMVMHEIICCQFVWPVSNRWPLNYWFLSMVMNA